MSDLQPIQSVETVDIRSRIYEVRGTKVMLDVDLARLYQVETKVLKQTVRRHIDRFPLDAMFELSRTEFAALRSQNVTSKQRGGTRYMPFAFTELGIAMLSSVLNSDVAIQVNLNIMRAFIALREMLNANLQVENIRVELANQRQYIEDILRDQNDTNADVQAQLDAISQSLAELQSEIKPRPTHHTVVEGFGRNIEDRADKQNV